MFFKKNIYYIRLFEDKIEVVDVYKNEKITRKSKVKYSNDRLVIADFYAVESEMRSVIKEFYKGILNTVNVVVFQPIHSNISKYSPVEKRCFRDSCLHANAKKVFLYFGNDELSCEEVIIGVKNESFEQ